MGVLFTHPWVEMGVLFRSAAIFNLSILDKIMFPLSHREWEAWFGPWVWGEKLYLWGLRKLVHKNLNEQCTVGHWDRRDKIEAWLVADDL